MKRKVPLRPLTPDERYKLVFKYQWSIYDNKTGALLLELPWTDGWLPGLTSEEQAERSLALALSKVCRIEGKTAVEMIDIEQESDEIKRDVIARSKNKGK